MPAIAKVSPKSYLMITHKDNGGLYYVDSEGVARKMVVRHSDIFVEKVRRMQEKNPGNVLSANKDLNAIIKMYVIPNKLQITRRSTKKIISLVGLGIAIAGVFAAMPTLGIPIAGAIAITSLGLGVVLLAPMVGQILKKGMNIKNTLNKTETKLPEADLSTLDTNMQIEKKLEEYEKEGPQSSLSKMDEKTDDKVQSFPEVGRLFNKTQSSSPASKNPISPENDESEDEGEGEGKGKGETFHIK